MDNHKPTEEFVKILQLVKQCSARQTEIIREFKYFKDAKIKVENFSKKTDIFMLQESKIRLSDLISKLMEVTETLKSFGQKHQKLDPYSRRTLEFHVSVNSRFCSFFFSALLQYLDESTKGIKKNNITLARIAGLSDKEIEMMNYGDLDQILINPSVHSEKLVDLKSRTNDLQNLLGKLEELFRLSKIINQMVNETDEKLRVIEDEADQIQEFVAQGRDDIKQARQYQVSRYKCIIITVVVILLILGAASIPIILKLKKNKKN